MKNLTIILLFPFLFISFNCESRYEKKNIHGQIIEEGYIECFPEKTYFKNNIPASCELSGVAYYNDSLFFINDKKIPATTPFMACRFKIPFFAKSLEKLGNFNVINARKLEDITVSPTQKYMFMITGFDKYKNNSSAYPAYNILFYKNLETGEEEKVAYAQNINDIICSYSLRYRIKNALKSKLYKKGPPYFKVAGLAAMPGDTLLIGIREIGYSKKKFNYTFTIIGAPYNFKDNIFSFTEELKVLYHFDPSDIPNIRKPIGITGIEYDFYNKQFFIVTAYELGKTDKDIGGYLWILPLKDFIENRAPKLVLNDNNLPFMFAHKPGGITILNSSKVFVVHDDDRITGDKVIEFPDHEFHRKLNQAAYTIIDF